MSLPDPQEEKAGWQKGDGLPPPKNAAEAVTRVLTHVERQAGRRTSEAAFDGLLAVPGTPLDGPRKTSARCRAWTTRPRPTPCPPCCFETDSPARSRSRSAPSARSPCCPPTARPTPTPVSALLYEAGLYPLFPADLDGLGDWHDRPLPRWLFPPA